MARFIGENNRLPGRVTGVRGAICDVDVSGRQVQALRVVPCRTGDSVLLSIRPERVSIAPEPGAYTNEFDATIDEVTLPRRPPPHPRDRLRPAELHREDPQRRGPRRSTGGGPYPHRLDPDRQPGPGRRRRGGCAMTGIGRGSAAAARVAALAPVLAMTAAASSCAPPPGESLTVISWGGSYAQAITKGYLEAFTAETGIEIRLDDYNGGLAQVRAQVETGNVHWDVIDLETFDAVSGCGRGHSRAHRPHPPRTGARRSAPRGGLPARRAARMRRRDVALLHRLRLQRRAPDRHETDHARGLLRPRALPRPPRTAARALREPRVRPRSPTVYPSTRCTPRSTRRKGSTALSASSTRSRTRWCGGKRARNPRRCSRTARW